MYPPSLSFLSHSLTRTITTPFHISSAAAPSSSSSSLGLTDCQRVAAGREASGQHSSGGGNGQSTNACLTVYTGDRYVTFEVRGEGGMVSLRGAEASCLFLCGVWWPSRPSQTKPNQTNTPPYHCVPPSTTTTAIMTTTGGGPHHARPRAGAPHSGRVDAGAGVRVAEAATAEAGAAGGCVCKWVDVGGGGGGLFQAHAYANNIHA